MKLVQNVLNASKFFADLSSKMNVKAAAKVSPEEMYKLMGVGSEKADTGNYVAYLADQIHLFEGAKMVNNILAGNDTITAEDLKELKEGGK